MPSAPTLNLKYVRSTDRTSITVTDLTGAYNVTTNPGGYGGVNVTVGDFTAFNISVYLPDPETLQPSTTAVVVNAWNSLPSSSDGTFVLTSLALLGTADTTLVDGVYAFEVSALWDDGIEVGAVTASNNKVFYEIVGCCIENMQIESVGCGCSGDSEKIQNLVLAGMYLDMLSPKVIDDAIVASAIERCGQWDKAATMLLELQDICDTENCGGCNGCN
jgi:hypothetical protein